MTNFQVRTTLSKIPQKSLILGVQKKSKVVVVVVVVFLVVVLGAELLSKLPQKWKFERHAK